MLKKRENARIAATYNNTCLMKTFEQGSAIDTMIKLEETRLVGLSLKKKTTNANDQANIDCGNLWQEFEAENYVDKIPGKLDNEVLAVYHQYEGDHTDPFSYFIGCRVTADSEVPPGLDSLVIPGGTYQKITAKGKMPDCIIDAWKDIWNSKIPRAYHTDFEVYGDESKEQGNVAVDIFLSIKQ